MHNWYVADFETTNYQYYQENGYTKVWLYAICDSNGEIVKYGDSIEDFFKWCYNQRSDTIYFHNLKFDGSFILNYLLNNGFEYKSKLLVKDNKGFSTLIGEEGQYYQIKVNFCKDRQIIFQDSLKIMPLKVKQIAKVFNLPIQKEIIDYGKYEINEETLSYVFNDVRIVAMGLKFFKDKGFNKMTIGSNSYNQFLQEVPYYKDLFPMLDKEFLIKWRKAYRGGRSQVNPKYQNKIVHNVKRFDINSMYPYVMSRMSMPYGNPIPIKTRGRYKFELYEIDVCFKLKKGHLPTLLKSGSIYSKIGDTYYIETDNIERILISNVDLELLHRHYDISYIDFIEMYGFKTSKHIFKEFIDKYYELKSTSTGGLKMVYKLIINNLYGKFGSKCVGRVKIPKLDEECLVFELSDEQDMRLYYLPVAIAITSYAHKLIDDAIMETGYEYFVYCDTDSVHTLGELPNDWIDSKIIGKFKLEGIEKTAKYIRQKCYIYEDENGYNITCAGMTDSLKEYLVREYKEDSFNVFKVGLKIDSTSQGIKLDDLKLRPLQVKGGTVLQPTSFSLL